jgi:DNA processing protein
MAGLSHAVLIIEAERQSGTMITAKLALDYNREVLTVPGSIFSRHTAGPHYLLTEGAQAVTCPADIINALKLTPPDPPAESKSFAGNKKSSRNLTLDFTRQFPAATADEIVILKILAESGEPFTKDALIERSGLPVSRANIAISLLELAGHIKESLGLVRRI